MSITIQEVTKIYGEQKALDNVSFNVNTGEILGFLGPNGAGKSTLMKIITCYIPPTKGNVTVEGINVTSNPLQVKKMVGYLPEHNPLYLDMYVKEYLSFIAGIHKMKNKKERVSEMIELVGLQVEQRKKIGALSKGYRQRVGLAQALIHDPKVLILDEPTSGLDPNQLEEIRNLIKEIGKEKTVMLSTHIMQEVEAICDRVVIINKGKLVADDKSDNLIKTSEKQQIITVEFDKQVNKDKLQKIKGVSKVKHNRENSWSIASHGKEDLRRVISEFAKENNLLVLEMTKEKESLEKVFKDLTK